MAADLSLKEQLEIEGRRFDKMNRPTSGVYRLAHAYVTYPASQEQEEAEPFAPLKMLKSMEGTIEQHLADHIAAVGRMTEPNSVDKK